MKKLLILLIVFILASITDFLDGKIARKYNLVTNFGKFMDPLADKLLVCAAMIGLVEMGRIPAWVVIIIMSREFIISGFRLIASDNGVVIAASYWGKFKTVSQMVFTILIMVLGEVYYILEKSYNEIFIKMPNLATVSNALLWITAIFTIVSGVVYLIDSRKIIDFTK